MVQCPVCSEGELKKGMITEIMFGINLGKFQAEICNKCDESFTDENTTHLIELAAKKKGIWGLGVKTKLAKTGNSLAVRIPKNIVQYLKLKEGKELFIHPQENKLVIETI